jgi:hypothetical protein
LSRVYRSQTADCFSLFLEERLLDLTESSVPPYFGSANGNSPRDEQLACYGISVAPNFPSNCRDITNADDQQMCYGMSENSQTPCMSIQDSNLKLACRHVEGAPVPHELPRHHRPGDAGLLLWCFQRPANGPQLQQRGKQQFARAMPGHRLAQCFLLLVHYQHQ